MWDCKFYRSVHTSVPILPSVEKGQNKNMCVKQKYILPSDFEISENNAPNISNSDFIPQLMYQMTQK